jgi:hypothetical protein
LKLALAAVLLVFAAAGLSSVAPNDYCTAALVPTSGDESAALYPRTGISVWPPGVRCSYPGGPASTTGDLAQLAVVLAAGPPCWRWRRSPTSC